jgi:Xaa-Pro aminopeptidase
VGREERIERVLRILKEKGVDACLLQGMDNIFYLTGFRGSDGALFVAPGGVTLLTDFRYITHAREVAGHIDVEESRDRRASLAELTERFGVASLGFDGIHTSYSEYRGWAEKLPSVELVTLEGEIEEIRRCKEPAEVEAIEAAVAVATAAFEEALERIGPGRTERDVANELDFAMRRRGAERPAFDTIVASGPRAALPHAVPTDREMGMGETVIIDFGAQVNGYCSDETCTVRLGAVDGELAEIFEIVNGARKAAIDSVAPGLPIKDLDDLVRSRIAAAGYGDYFRHGTGHGVGIAVHEAPSVGSRSAGVLEEGMVITIEPGIYMPSLGGVRLEDLVLVTARGPRVLTRIEKEALVVG